MLRPGGGQGSGQAGAGKPGQAGTGKFSRNFLIIANIMISCRLLAAMRLISRKYPAFFLLYFGARPARGGGRREKGLGNFGKIFLFS